MCLSARTRVPTVAPVARRVGPSTCVDTGVGFRAMLAVDRIGSPPSLLAALMHVASLHNPDMQSNTCGVERARVSVAHPPIGIRPAVGFKGGGTGKSRWSTISSSDSGSGFEK
jgi:hypothetical protein